MLKNFLKIFSPLGVDKLCLSFPMSMSGTISEKETTFNKCCTPLLTDTAYGAIFKSAVPITAIQR